MTASRRENRDALACADVLGAFGATASDAGIDPADASSLDDALAERLAAVGDRTAFLRETIARSDRGLDCSARYATAALERELRDVFSSFQWSIEVSERADGLALRVSDRTGRTRETTVTYPDTPLADDNLPAVLHAVNEDLIDGIGGRFVLLSSGIDRWRASLVETDELDRLREAYGERIEVFDRPLLPVHDVAAYVPSAGGGGGEPWPTWAIERAERGPSGDATGRDSGDASGADPSAGEASDDEVAALIERVDDGGADADDAAETGDGTDDRGDGNGGEPTVREWTSGDGAGAGGFELAGGGPTVSRSADDADDLDPAAAGGDGALSGGPTTERVSNDSFGTDYELATEDDRYRALGAALGTGRNVSVRGLLEDDEFLPELPAAEPETTRLTFEDDFDPTAVSKAQASAEESGFEWVDPGSMESERVHNV